MFDPANHPSSGPGQPSIERLNRDNFRACLEALARPGRPRQITPLFDSHLLGIASSLLYSKIRYCYRGNLADFQLVEAMTGATTAPPAVSNYLFADAPSLDLWHQADPGSMDHPETSATCVFACPATGNTSVLLRGPGIKEICRTHLPLEQAFVEGLIDKKPPFPLGADLFLLDESGRILGLPRTTVIEVLR